MTDLSEQYTLKAEELAGESQFSNSNFYLRKAIPIYKNAGNWMKMVECYIKLGNNYKDIDDFKKALEHLDQALNLTLEHLGHKPLSLAKSYIKLAYKYFHQKKDYKKALELYQKALDIEKDVLGENHREVAKIYNSIALLYWNKGNSEKAVTYYNKSFSIKLKHLMQQGITIAKDYKFLDRETLKKGTFNDARKSFRQSLTLHRETYGDNHPIMASIYENIGILQAIEGDYDKAMKNLRKSLSIRLDAFGHENLKSASSFHNIGICLRLQGDYDQAKRFLNNALAIKLDLLGKYHTETADTYYQLGNVEQAQGEFNNALTYYQDALIAMVPDFSATDFYLNPESFRAQSDDKLLKVLAAKALTLRKRYLLEPVGNDDLQASLATYSLISRLIENIRSGFKSENYKLFFGEKCIEIYGRAVQTAFKLYEISGNPEYKEKAFIFSEKSKAAVLSEAVSESQARRFAGIPDYLLEKEKKLKIELALYDTYLEKEYQKDPPGDKERLRSIEEHYFMLKDEYRNLIEHFERNFKKYFDLKYKSRSVSIPDMRQALAPDTALIEYFLIAETIYIFVLTPDGIEAVSQPAAEDFRESLIEFYNSIKKIEEKKFLNLSHYLYGILIKPVRHLLIDKMRLIIIPHGQLHYIPFETLASGPILESDFSWIDYLIKHFSFNYHYSANLWLYNTKHDKSKVEKNFIGFAPVFSDTEERDLLKESENPVRDIIMDEGEVRYPELPATEKELHAIITLFKNANKKAFGYFHDQATEDIFKSEDMKNYNYIHIATHSLKDRGSAKLSGLIFSRPNSSANSEDGILYSSEIYNLNLNAKLVVLSSCESGIGRLVKGEGMFALARGFFYAGVQNIIFSLWKVEDKTTSQLMIELYRNILAGEKLPAALQKAKIKMIKNRFTAFPKYWSGFTLVGE
jgi:CHAT domain-containing protein/Tfp pilus assembly protein PilF